MPCSRFISETLVHSSGF